MMNTINTSERYAVSRVDLGFDKRPSPDITQSVTKGEALQVTQSSHQSSVLDNASKVSKASLSDKELLSKLEEVNQQLKGHHSYLQFKVDEKTGIRLFQIFDEKTHEVIKQFPSEGFLKVSAQIKDFLKSNQVDHGQLKASLTGKIVNESV